MDVKPEYRNRDDREVAVLEALVERGNEGMTVFEIRSRVDIDIDDIEQALAHLKRDNLIDATEDGNRTLIIPIEDVIGYENGESQNSFLQKIRDNLLF